MISKLSKETKEKLYRIILTYKAANLISTEASKRYKDPMGYNRKMSISKEDALALGDIFYQKITSGNYTDISYIVDDIFDEYRPAISVNGSAYIDVPNIKIGDTVYNKAFLDSLYSSCTREKAYNYLKEVAEEKNVILPKMGRYDIVKKFLNNMKDGSYTDFYYCMEDMIMEGEYFDYDKHSLLLSFDISAAYADDHYAAKLGMNVYD